MNQAEEKSTAEQKNHGFDEKLVEILLTIILPLFVGIISFGSIVLAFAQWKLY